MNVQKASPRMRALFREVARDIVARDRHARRLGISQNTIGEIVSAMVKAYKFGQEALVDESMSLKDTSRIDWLDVPPRSRATLSRLTSMFSNRFAIVSGNKEHVFDAKAQQIEKAEILGRSRWILVFDDKLSEFSVADGSVAPLIRLGLLSPLTATSDRYELTEVGLQLCRDYWSRSDANDPTLPRAGF